MLWLNFCFVARDVYNILSDTVITSILTKRKRGNLCSDIMKFILVVNKVKVLFRLLKKNKERLSERMRFF